MSEKKEEDDDHSGSRETVAETPRAIVVRRPEEAASLGYCRKCHCLGSVDSDGLCPTHRQKK